MTLFWIYFSFVYGSTGVRTQSFMLGMQAYSQHFSFVLIILSGRVLHISSDYIPPPYSLPNTWDHKCLPPHLAYWLKRGLYNFFHELAFTPIVLISTSWVAGIILVSHCTWIFYLIYMLCLYIISLFRKILSFQ
jgi:hypothetical protein